MATRSRQVCVPLAAAAAAALIVMAACKTAPTAPTGPTVGAFVSAVSTFGSSNNTGVFQPGPAPAPQPGGPPASAIGGTGAIPGGASAYVISSPVPFQKIFISVNAPIGTTPPADLDGFFEITRASADTTADVLISFGANIPASSFNLRFQVATSNGPVGSASSISTNIVVQPPVGVLTLSGQISQISPPVNAQVGALESDTTTQIFRERASLVVGSAIIVDITEPGTYAGPLTSSGGVPAGSRFDSYYLVTDPVGADPNVNRNYVGSVTFDTDVLGVLGSQLIGSTNQLLGAPGTSYSPGSAGIETGDSVTISADRRTVSFNLIAAGGSDNLRIIVASPALPAAATARLLSLAETPGTASCSRLLSHRPSCGL